MSKGESKIKEILNKNNLIYDTEVGVPHLSGKKGIPLRFDFAIYYNKKIVAFIEFDGEQHFYYTTHFYKNQSDFSYRKGCDRKKNEWALKRGISLYRVPYWELDNIKELKDIFNLKFLVTNIYHNDRLIREKFGG